MWGWRGVGKEGGKISTQSFVFLIGCNVRRRAVRSRLWAGPGPGTRRGLHTVVYIGRLGAVCPGVTWVREWVQGDGWEAAMLGHRLLWFLHLRNLK
jgi:hypothetical protein